MFEHGDKERSTSQRVSDVRHFRLASFFQDIIDDGRQVIIPNFVPANGKEKFCWLTPIKKITCYYIIPEFPKIRFFRIEGDMSPGIPVAPDIAEPNVVRLISQQ
jgi:hypothetical protein